MAGKPIARAFVDQFACPKHPPAVALIPALSPVTRTVDGFPVIRLGDYGVCMGGKGNIDVVVEGSDSTFVCGLPIARKGDAMLHGGAITTGSPTEDDGGGTFSLPKNLKIGGSNVFAGKVVRDLFFLSRTPNGQQTLDRIAAQGQEVVIVSGRDNKTEPDDPESVRKGGKSGSTIYYDPDKTDIHVDGKNGTHVPCPPQVNLGHELIHAARFGRGGATLGTIHEEKRVIGPPFGPKDKDPNWPTENGLRKDLGLGERTGYGHKEDPTQPSPNLRPGACP